MKKLALLSVLIIVALSIGCLDKPVGRQEFKRAHAYLNKRVDTLSRNQRTMIHNQKVMYRNQKALLDSIRMLNARLSQLSGKLDTLNAQVHNLEVGQYVIYDAITSPQQPNAQSKESFLNLRKWFRKQK